MKTKYLLPAFIITALLQLAAPLKMVYDSETTERQGTVYKFKTEPIDPTDPFRGKYVTLSFEDSRVTSKLDGWKQEEKVYVYVKDSAGFAKVCNVSRHSLKTDRDYFMANVDYFNGSTLRLSFPFDRYYMEESKAPDAETAYRTYTNDSGNNDKPAYALVAVKDGNAVLKDVIIDGKPIKEYVEQQRKAER